MGVLKKIKNFLLRGDSSNKIDIVFILASLSTYSVLTFMTISNFAFGFDESYSAYVIKHSYFDVAKYMTTDLNSPLHYWLLKFWSSIFGSSEAALRSLSLVFGALAIFVAFLLVKKLFGKAIARLSVIFLSISPMIIGYGQEARMHMMALFFGVLATYLLVVALGSKKKLHWALYGISVGLSILTHYMFILIPIAHLVWRIVEYKKSTGKIKGFLSPEWVIAIIACISTMLLWLPFMISQFIVLESKGFWVPAFSIKNIVDFICEIFTYRLVDWSTGWVAVGVMFIIIFSIVSLLKMLARSDKLLKLNLKLIVFSALLPVLCLILLSLPPLSSCFIDRYLLFSVFLIPVLVSVAILNRFIKINPIFRLLVIGIVIVISVIGVNNVRQVGNNNQSSNIINQGKNIMVNISNVDNQSCPVIVNTPRLFYELEYYAKYGNKVYFIDNDSYYDIGFFNILKDDNDHKIVNLNKFTNSVKCFWYVVPVYSQYDVLENQEKPSQNWRVLNSFSITYPTTGETQYRAVKYEVINKD